MAAAKQDLSEFYKYSKPKRPPCRIGHALELIETGEDDSASPNVKKGDAKRLRAALDVDKNLIPAAAIITWLQTRGNDTVTNVSPITTHRKHTCTCYDD
jgi:hypothetical protein